MSNKTKQYPSDTGGHYKCNDHDLIIHWQLTHVPAIVRAKVVSQIERYCVRYGLKDDPLKEAKKIQDYANRLVQYEEEQLK